MLKVDEREVTWNRAGQPVGPSSSRYEPGTLDQTIRWRSRNALTSARQAFGQPSVPTRVFPFIGMKSWFYPSQRGLGTGWGLIFDA